MVTKKQVNNGENKKQVNNGDKKASEQWWK